MLLELCYFNKRIRSNHHHLNPPPSRGRRKRKGKYRFPLQTFKDIIYILFYLYYSQICKFLDKMIEKDGLPLLRE